MKKKGVLITTNPLDHEGGVVNYYRVFFDKFDSPDIAIKHLAFGSRMKDFYSPLKKRLVYPLYYCFDLIRFFWHLVADRHIRIVQVSPSLIPVPLIRDAGIVLIAKALRRSVIVFYRGWKEDVVDQVKHRPIVRRLFRLVYDHVDATIVLASHFKDDLIEMGWKSKSIEVTTTMYEAEEIINPVDRSGQIPRFLFLGRLSQLKGIDQLIDAARLLDERGVEFQYLVVGHGDREGVLDAYKEQVSELGMDDRFHFTGRLTGRDKYEAYANSDVYVFPSWTEGCPSSVLEALGSGLYVISTDVGALREIIREGENGRIVRLKDPEHLTELMQWAVDNIDDIRRRRNAIQRDAKGRYEVAVVCRQFKEIYKGLIDGK